MDEVQLLELVDAAGSIVPGEVIISEAEDKLGVRIRWLGQELSATENDAFSALRTVRLKLSEQGLIPRCYGACRNLVVSGMAAQMAGGLKGFLVRLGQQARMSDLVEIFDAGPDMDLVSVTEQQEFTLTWYRSLGIPY